MKHLTTHGKPQQKADLRILKLKGGPVRFAYVQGSTGVRKWISQDIFLRFKSLGFKIVKDIR